MLYASLVFWSVSFLVAYSSVCENWNFAKVAADEIILIFVDSRFGSPIGSTIVKAYVAMQIYKISILMFYIY